VVFNAFAVAAPGLEPLAAAELRALGVADATAERGGVAFVATEPVLATALLHLRTVNRVLVRVAEFRATSFAQLERRAKAVKWNAWVVPGGRVRFRVTCRKSKLYHSDAVAQRLASAVRGLVRGATIVAGAADDEDADDLAQMFVVRVADNVCTISADAAGAALHRRGYRLAVAKAPIRETLAAAMLLGAGWDGSTALYDPMCGSGTLVIEAALMARRIAPGIHRTFAAERWPASNARVWKTSRDDAKTAELPRSPVLLVGSDRDRGAIEGALANAERAGVAADVTFSVAPVSAVRAPNTSGLLVTNPPFGVRVGNAAELRDLYARLGQVARERFSGWRCAILSADKTPGHSLERQLALPLEEAWRTTNGGIGVTLLVSEKTRGREDGKTTAKTRSRRRG
jgi:putative N6-adenine-specific DNA methylase